MEFFFISPLPSIHSQLPSISGGPVPFIHSKELGLCFSHNINSGVLMISTGNIFSVSISIITSYKSLQLCDSSSWELNITVFSRRESNQSRQPNCLWSVWVSTAFLRMDESCLITSTSVWRNWLLEHIQHLAVINTVWILFPFCHPSQFLALVKQENWSS
jgi:hypothetical protein